MKFRIFSLALLLVVTASSGVYAKPAQRRGAKPKNLVCGNPQVACNTSVTFQPHNLPFRVPSEEVISESELFYAVILKTVGHSEDDCDMFVPESERLAAQALFPQNKVFASRCPDVEDMTYTNVSPNHRFMAVYAGHTSAEAKKMLTAVKATGKFADAMIRRMRTGFNGT